MSNFVVLGTMGTDTAVQNAVFGAVYEGRVPNAKYIHSPTPTGFQGKLYRLSRRGLFRRFLPAGLRMHWEVTYRQMKPLLSGTEDNYIVFCPGTHPLERISPMLLRALRKHHPECKLILYFVDGVERTAQISGITVTQLQAFFPNFDAVFTYDREDAQKYGLAFIEVPVWISDEASDAVTSVDLYFCGRDKDRSGLLLDVYDKATEAGLRCRYRIVSPTGEYRRDGVQVAKWMPYRDTVREARQANCILEVLADSNHGATLRYKEAVIYNKKLLTNNPEIAHLPYYDARWMRYFENAADVDPEWLGRVENVDYGYKGDFSAGYFLQEMERIFKAECLGK